MLYGWIDQYIYIVCVCIYIYIYIMNDIFIYSLYNNGPVDNCYRKQL